MKFLAEVLGHSHFGTARPGPDHTGLNSAFAERDAALKLLESKRAVLVRFDEISHAADVASRAASNAVRAASEYRQQWVRSGCPFSDHAEVQRLDDAAAASKAAAERTSLDAKAVDRERMQAQAAVRSAESDLETCDEKIAAEVGLILVAEFDAAHDLARGARLAAEYQAWRIAARGLQNALKGSEANRLLQAAIDRANSQIQNIEDYSVTPQGSVVGSIPTEVRAGMEHWTERANALRGAP